jgi:DNA-binding MltR family transcriptional regulator
MARRRVLDVKTSPDLMVAFQQWFSEVNSDRTFAIVGGTIVENCLELYLKSRMRDLELSKGRSVFGNLFDSNGPLSTFSGKNNLAYAAGFVGPIFFKDLEVIREVRNQFAHDLFAGQKIDDRPVVLSFDSQEIVDQLKKLSEHIAIKAMVELAKKQNANVSLSRQRFTFGASSVAMELCLAMQDKEIRVAISS